MGRLGLIIVTAGMLLGHPAVAMPSLQALIDEAEKGAVIRPPAGTYHETLIIDKPITLEGHGEVIIDAGGKGTVISIETDGATVSGFTLRNSGESHNDIDSGVRVAGNYNLIRDNIIEDCLFGVDLQQANNNIVKRNRITSKPFHLGVRGDAIRLWYSRDNKIADNHVTDTRDMVVWYSANNHIKGNSVHGGRYGLHFMYSKYNLVEDNSFRDNSVGIFLMYSDDVVLRGNRIVHAQGATGMGIGMKETSNTDITDNEILYCGTGIYLDVSPFQPDTTNRIYRNTVAFSKIGLLFHNDWQGNLVKDNRFIDNIRQVSVNEYAGAARNEWEGNYWDDYEGFDENGDGFGDRPHKPKVFADRIWMDVPPAAFFLGTPLLSMVDFLERLAPFTEPLIMLADAKPRMSAEFTPLTKRAAASSADSSTETGRYDPFGLDDPNKGRLIP
ncbi:nitrous oxide reductase family maturation protein NosD [Magnetospira sp. QH-2]|uniref:nitrous oxide reductase family maturation protein NosD n=1 Tax=Magnetospira sp. (strain QH-2) TaxID=1288970 RepID=UPI0003E8142F|nr:nitrous oxide reductase family maturation protein NosD [Magnetospira sp. QH-2]CCQ73149.1 Nitrous oxidase accessory protein. Copper-binding periplasmic protein [Magnetospira sp. QH-2]